MIYKNEVLINWKNPVSKDDVLVRDEIIEVKNKYFSDNTHKAVKILYPAGEPDLSQGGFPQLKVFLIPLTSTDGEWRWSAAKMTTKTKTNPKGFVDHHYTIRHGDVLREKDIEFIWFLKNRSSQLNKRIFIEDLEGKATEKVKELASDADIKFMLMGNKSPIANDEKLIREVASIFGLRDVEKLKINELKLALYERVLEGEKSKDKYVNFERFEEITEGNNTRKAAYLARIAINDKMIIRAFAVAYKVDNRAILWQARAEKDFRQSAEMLKMIEDWSKSIGCNRMIIKAKDEKLARFYNRRYGFDRVGLHRQYYLLLRLTSSPALRIVPLSLVRYWY